NLISSQLIFFFLNLHTPSSQLPHLLPPSIPPSPSLSLPLRSTTHGGGSGIAASSSSPARRWPHGLSLSPALSHGVGNSEASRTGPSSYAGSETGGTTRWWRRDDDEKRLIEKWSTK
ncbi:hypothetical protein LINGRAHAP2_LOCUS24390, partial [Linum grandiflorum]